MKIIEIKPYDNFEIYFTLVLCKTRKQMQTVIKKNNPDTKVLNKNTTGMVSPADYFTQWIAFVFVIGEIHWRKLTPKEKAMSLWAING